MANYAIIRYRDTSTIIELPGEVNYHPYHPAKSVIPGAPDYIEGIAFLSDFPAPIIINLGKFLGLEHKKNTERILMELEVSNGKVAFVIPVPEVIEGEVTPHSMFPQGGQTNLPVSEYVKYGDEILLKLEPAVLIQLATQDIKEIVKPINISGSAPAVKRQVVMRTRSPVLVTSPSQSAEQNVVSIRLGSITFLIEEKYVSDIFPFLGMGMVYPIQRTWIRGMLNTDIGVALGIDLNDYLELPDSESTMDILLKVGDNSYIINADSAELMDVEEMVPVFTSNSENYFVKNIFYLEQELSFLLNVEVLARFIATNSRPAADWKDIQKFFQLERHRIEEGRVDESEDASVNYVGLAAGEGKIFLDRDDVEEVVLFSPPIEKDGLRFAKYRDGLVPSLYLSDLLGTAKDTSRVSALVKLDDGQLVAVHADYALNFDNLKLVFDGDKSRILSPEIAQSGSFKVVEVQEDMGMLLGASVFKLELEKLEKASGSNYAKYSDDHPSEREEDVVVHEGVWYENVETFLVIPGEETYYSIDEIEKFEVSGEASISATLSTGELIELPVGVGLISVNAKLIEEDSSNKVILLEDKKIDVKILGGTS